MRTPKYERASVPDRRRTSTRVRINCDRLMADFEPKSVWRTVLAWQFARERGAPPWGMRFLGGGERGTSWRNRTPSIACFRERDAEFDWKGVYFLVLFDALDRCADDWKQMYRAIRGLLQAALELLSYRRLRVKIFLRSDQADRAQIADFPGRIQSPVLHREPELAPARPVWPVVALPGQRTQRERAAGVSRRRRLAVRVRRQAAFVLPFRGSSFVDEDLLRETFHRIAGPSMGGNYRRGRPYTWVANHLGRCGPEGESPIVYVRAENGRRRYVGAATRITSTPCTTTASSAACRRPPGSASESFRKTIRGCMR